MTTRLGRELRDLGRSPSLIVFGRLAGTAATLVSAPITARALGPDGRGETAAAIAVFFIVPVVLGLGVPLEVRRQHAVHRDQGVLGASRVLAIASVVPAALIAATLHQTLFASFEPAAALVAALGVAATPLAFSWACDLGVVLADQRYLAVFAMQMAHPTLYVTTIATLWIADLANVTTVLAANIAGTLLTFVVGLWLTRHTASGRSSALDLLRRGIQFAGSGIAESASNKLDQALALPILGAYAAGIYSIGVTIASAPLALGHALSAATFPRIARAAPEGRPFLQAQAVRAALALGLLIAPVMVLLSWLLIPLIFGERFAPAFTVVAIAAPGTVAMMAAFVASTSLAADSRGWMMTASQIVGLAVSTALLIVLGLAYGSAGAAAASAAGYVVLFGCLMASLKSPLRQLAPRFDDGRRSIRLLRKADLE